MRDGRDRVDATRRWGVRLHRIAGPARFSSPFPGPGARARAFIGLERSERLEAAHQRPLDPRGAPRQAASFDLAHQVRRRPGADPQLPRAARVEPTLHPRPESAVVREQREVRVDRQQTRVEQGGGPRARPVAEQQHAPSAPFEQQVVRALVAVREAAAQERPRCFAEPSRALGQHEGRRVQGAARRRRGEVPGPGTGQRVEATARDQPGQGRAVVAVGVAQHEQPRPRVEAREERTQRVAVESRVGRGARVEHDERQAGGPRDRAGPVPHVEQEHLEARGCRGPRHERDRPRDAARARESRSAVRPPTRQCDHRREGDEAQPRTGSFGEELGRAGQVVERSQCTDHRRFHRGLHVSARGARKQESDPDRRQPQEQGRCHAGRGEQADRCELAERDPQRRQRPDVRDDRRAQGPGDRSFGAQPQDARGDRAPRPQPPQGIQSRVEPATEQSARHQLTGRSRSRGERERRTEAQCHRRVAPGVRIGHEDQGECEGQEPDRVASPRTAARPRVRHEDEDGHDARAHHRGTRAGQCREGDHEQSGHDGSRAPGPGGRDRTGRRRAAQQQVSTGLGRASHRPGHEQREQTHVQSGQREQVARARAREQVGDVAIQRVAPTDRERRGQTALLVPNVGQGERAFEDQVAYARHHARHGPGTVRALEDHELVRRHRDVGRVVDRRCHGAARALAALEGRQEQDPRTRGRPGARAEEPGAQGLAGVQQELRRAPVVHREPSDQGLVERSVEARPVRRPIERCDERARHHEQQTRDRQPAPGSRRQRRVPRAAALRWANRRAHRSTRRPGREEERERDDRAGHRRRPARPRLQLRPQIRPRDRRRRDPQPGPGRRPSRRSDSSALLHGGRTGARIDRSPIPG